MKVDATKPGAPVSDDLRMVDDYLEKWDRFAQGENELGSFLRANKVNFETTLTRLIKADDKRAAARMVFYPVIQVDGAIPFDSELGKACAELLGGSVPVMTIKDGKRIYFAGDLYLWWDRNRGKYENYPLFDEWSQRDYAKKVVVPMYKSASEGK